MLTAEQREEIKDELICDGGMPPDQAHLLCLLAEGHAVQSGVTELAADTLVWGIIDLILGGQLIVEVKGDGVYRIIPAGWRAN